jgi:peptidyl-prolyl cis-trans isomerase B (cyclophilin B)
MNGSARIALAAFAVAFALPLAAAEPSARRSCADLLKGTSPMKVKLTTSMGPITIELDKAKAPVSAENFVKYVESGHYNGTIFHRVIDGFMVQGGGFDKEMRQKATNPPIKNEADNGLKNDKYTVAMARTQVPDSASSQFFINVKDNAFLNHTAKNVQGWGYAVFGKVVEGKDVVDKIQKVPTGSVRGMGDVPLEPVVIEKAECVA